MPTVIMHIVLVVAVHQMRSGLSRTPDMFGSMPTAVLQHSDEEGKVHVVQLTDAFRDRTQLLRQS